MRGHTPTMLLATSSSDGMDSSLVTMAQRRLQGANIQSRCSAPLNLVTRNSVMEDGSKDPKTDEDFFAGIVSGISDQTQGTQQLGFILYANGAARGNHLMTSGKVARIIVAAGLVTNWSKKHKCGKKSWRQQGTILVNSSFEHKYYHHQTPALTTPRFDPD